MIIPSTASGGKRRISTSTIGSALGVPMSIQPPVPYSGFFIVQLSGKQDICADRPVYSKSADCNVIGLPCGVRSAARPHALENLPSVSKFVKPFSWTNLSRVAIQ